MQINCCCILTEKRLKSKMVFVNIFIEWLWVSLISIGLDQDPGQDHGVVVGNQETEEIRGKQWWLQISFSVC